MEWRDTGFVLGTRRHGESALIVELLTREHGRHAGLVRGGQSPRRRALLQPGNEVAAAWRGRLAEHLGTLDCELSRRTPRGFSTIPTGSRRSMPRSALLLAALPEREPHPDCHASFAALLGALEFCNADWPGAAYVVWECDLLAGARASVSIWRAARSPARTRISLMSRRAPAAPCRARPARPITTGCCRCPGFCGGRDAGQSRRHRRRADSDPAFPAAPRAASRRAAQLPEARERLFERMRRLAGSAMSCYDPRSIDTRSR